MSEQQLTVAELMARAAKEGGQAGNSSRRRRRRNLEDGGVSVAELTGSIPKVKAKPVEARHTSHPIDAPVEDTPAPAVPKAPAPKAKTQPAVQADVPITVVGENDPVRLTTDSFPAQRRQATASAPAPSKPMVPQKPTEEERTETEPVEVAPPNRQGQGIATKLPHSNQDVRDTAIIPVVPETSAPAPAAAPVSEAPVSVAPSSLEPNLAEVERIGDDEEREDASAEEGENRVSVASVFLMAILGIIVGVGLFLGFKILWANLSVLLVAILAIAMTLGIVGVVHALRTERDGMSMGLAAVAGLAMTFGPYLVAHL